jgi:hypothetical protein
MGTQHPSRLRVLAIIGVAPFMGSGFLLLEAAAAKPKEQMTQAIHFTIAPTLDEYYH